MTLLVVLTQRRLRFYSRKNIIMCLYPRLIANKKYSVNNKNGGEIPAVPDKRVLMVPTKCGNCMECRKSKMREWVIRLTEDIKQHKNGKCVTLTFSNEKISQIHEAIKIQTNGEIWKIKHLGITTKETEKAIQKLKNKQSGYELDNAIATYAVRHFTENWRKEFTTAPRHWLITELGHNGTENIHLHGIIWTNESYDKIEQHWQYGYIWPKKYLNKTGTWIRHATYVNNQSINYFTKYITKTDQIYTTYKPVILCSKGIGRNYTNTLNAKSNKYNYNNTNETYRTPTGNKLALPIYYRNKIYTDNEREDLWLQKLDKQQRWILGIPIDISKSEKQYYEMLQHARKENKSLGYGTDKTTWNKKNYEEARRIIMQNKRIHNNNSNDGALPQTPSISAGLG